MLNDVLIFLCAAAGIGVAGTKLAGYADRLADRTGLGEALTGTLFLGLITALPGLAASVTAAVHGKPALALSNAMGGIAFQTAILAFADLAHREANLEHAAASAENIMQTILLVFLMTLVLMGLGSPNVTISHIHPASFLLVLAVIPAFWLTRGVRKKPMWKPERTRETVEDVPQPDPSRESSWLLSLKMLAAGSITLFAGAWAAQGAGRIAERSGISEAMAGGLFLAAATSLPELIVCVAAVRRRALTLAVSNIVGGNFFDVLFVAAADFAFLQGSLYHSPAIGRSEWFVTCLPILLNVILLAGLVYRQKHGPGNIGFESVLLVAVYLAGYITLSLSP